jgi:hypothetical protein
MATFESASICGYLAPATDPIRRVGDVTAAGEWARQLGLRGADHEAKHGVECGQPIAVLNTQVSLPNPFVPAFRNSRGLRLTAADADWTHGERGPIVRGPAADLVSVLGDRPAMLARLDGDGVDVLASRVSRHLIRRAG